MHNNSENKREKFTPNIGEAREQFKDFDHYKCVDEMILKDNYNMKIYSEWIIEKWLQGGWPIVAVTLISCE